MDQSDDFDLLRLADIDDEKVAYGFYASAPCTLNFEVNDVIIETIIYESIDPIEITLDQNDESIVSLSIIGESFSNELEFKHIDSFRTYHTTLFADHLETPSFDETLLVQRSVVLLIWDTGLEAQIITIVITMLLYVFFLGTPQFLTKFKHIKFNIWLKRIFLHLIGSFVFYGLIIFILVFFWGEEDEDGLYDSVTIYEDTTNAFDLTATLGITKVNGYQKRR